ncbi:hypothetical protein [Bordetella sp. LUAb4]|uniref:hypothetical protein n=1 Tax=Bordetella sp. LUAb4 TaxID=2843195 RepID=UPI001E5DCB44|nr:hypothetical protein [Bordetella sp. LUAb4]
MKTMISGNGAVASNSAYDSTYEGAQGDLPPHTHVISPGITQDGRATTRPLWQPCAYATGTPPRGAAAPAQTDQRLPLPAYHASPSPAPQRASSPGEENHCSLFRSLHALPPELKEKCPDIVAVSEDHWVLHCADNVERRYVPEYIDGAFFPGSDGRLYCTDMLGHTPDSEDRPFSLGTQLAAYEYYGKEKMLAYHIAGNPVGSLIAESPLYPLAPGRFMVVQPYGKSHLLAAVQAVMAEGKSNQAAAAQLSTFKWDIPIPNACTLRTYLLALAYQEGRDVAIRSGTNQDWFDSGIHQVTRAMAAVGGPCLLLYGGHAVIIDQIDYYRSHSQNPMWTEWRIRMRQVRTGSYMEVNHPGAVLAAAQELTVQRISPHAPPFEPLAPQKFGRVNWDAFCIAVRPGSVSRRQQAV